MSFEFGKRRRSRRSHKRSRRTRRSRRASVGEEVKVSRKRSKRSRRKGRRSGRRGGSSDAKALFAKRAKAVQVLMKKGMGRKAAWKKVVAGRAFGVQIIPGF